MSRMLKATAEGLLIGIGISCLLCLLITAFCGCSHSVPISTAEMKAIVQADCDIINRNINARLEADTYRMQKETAATTLEATAALKSSKCEETKPGPDGTREIPIVWHLEIFFLAPLPDESGGNAPALKPVFGPGSGGYGGENLVPFFASADAEATAIVKGTKVVGILTHKYNLLEFEIVSK